MKVKHGLPVAELEPLDRVRQDVVHRAVTIKRI